MYIDAVTCCRSGLTVFEIEQSLKKYFQNSRDLPGQGARLRERRHVSTTKKGSKSRVSPADVSDSNV